MQANVLQISSLLVVFLTNLAWSGEGWNNLVDDSRYLATSPARWWREDRPLVYTAGGTLIGTMVLDDEIREKLLNWKDTDPSEDLRLLGDRGQLLGPAIGTLVGIEGLITDNAKSKETAWLTYESFIAGGLIVGATKILVGRARPSTTDDPAQFNPFHGDSSFPSGHTTSAFAAATVFSEQYPKWYIVVPSYGVAGAIGFSRMYANKHWFSDVAAGAMLGTLVSHTLRKRHRQRNKQETAWVYDGEYLRWVKKF